MALRQPVGAFTDFLAVTIISSRAAAQLGQPKRTRTTVASRTDPSFADLMKSTTAPAWAVGLLNERDPLNGPREVLPPVTKPAPSGCVTSSDRTCAWTVPSKATEVPASTAGDLSAASQIGCAKEISAAAAPRTHHELSAPSWRTKTVVSGPVALARTETSPDRASPCLNGPIIGAVMCR